MDLGMGEGPDGERAGAGAAPGEPRGHRRETRVTAAVLAAFALLLIVQERMLLVAMSHGGQVPYPTWQLLTPVGFGAFALLLPIRARIAFLALVGLFWSVVAMADATYFRFFGSVTSLVSAGSAHQLVDVSDSVRDVVAAADAVFPLAFVALGAVAVLPARHLLGERPPLDLGRRGRAFGRAAGAFVLLALVARFTPIYEDTHHIGREKWVMPADHWGSRYSFTTYATTFGLYNYHLNDLVQAIGSSRARRPLDADEYAVIDRVLEEKRRLNALPTPLAGVARGRRVVFVQLEAITHWVLDLEVDGQPVMPFLSAMARRGLAWDFVMDVTSIGRTSDAEFAVMTGLLPDTSRPNSFTHADRAHAYLPRTLKSMGYATASYHGYKKSFWNRTYTHPVYGFDAMFFDESYDRAKILGLGVPDEVVYDFLVERLASEPARSFSFVISLTSHHPFVYTPAGYERLFPTLDSDEGWGLLGPYLRSARYTDDALARFFASMEERGLARDTVFVFYGDHDMGHLATEKTLPGMSKLAYTIAEERVPLVVVIPGQEEPIASHRAAHTDATGGLQDLFPTLMHLLGEPVPRGVMGTNLLVPDALREPVPMPEKGTDLLFAFRHAIYSTRGAGPIDPRRDPSPSRPERMPTLMEAMRDQLIVRDLLDHPDYWQRASGDPASLLAVGAPN